MFGYFWSYGIIGIRASRRLIDRCRPWLFTGTSSPNVRWTPSRPRSNRLTLEWLEPRLLLDAGPLVITEFMASNVSTLLDGDGKSSDWIEIYDPTDAPLSLDGWYLTDETDERTKWEFPEVTLAAAGDPNGDDYLLVFASDRDNADYPYRDGAGYLHTNFALSKGGDSLLLADVGVRL